MEKRSDDFAEFKVKVAFEEIWEDMTLAELCRKDGVPPILISGCLLSWRTG